MQGTASPGSNSSPSSWGSTPKDSEHQQGPQRLRTSVHSSGQFLAKHAISHKIHADLAITAKQQRRRPQEGFLLSRSCIFLAHATLQEGFILGCNFSFLVHTAHTHHECNAPTGCNIAKKSHQLSARSGPQT